MSWLRRTAYIWNPSAIIQGVVNNEYDGSGPSVDQPQGGWAYQELQRMGPLPEVCEMINFAAGENPAARAKMRVLSEAAGCPWNPQSPPQQQEAPSQVPQFSPETAAPMIGEQEKPMNMPSAEID